MTDKAEVIPITDGKIFRFTNLPRRHTFAKLSQNYAAMLVDTVTASQIDDGTLDENVLLADRRLVRDMDRHEMRHAAVFLACQFFLALLMTRAGFETPTNPKSGLVKFAQATTRRICAHWINEVGDGLMIVADPEVTKKLLEFEKPMSIAVIEALLIEARADPRLDEAQFWFDVFMGFSDGDRSGVVSRAAHMVLLHHREAFRAALKADTDYEGPDNVKH